MNLNPSKLRVWGIEVLGTSARADLVEDLGFRLPVLFCGKVGGVEVKGASEALRFHRILSL